MPDLTPVQILTVTIGKGTQGTSARLFCSRELSAVTLPVYRLTSLTRGAINGDDAPFIDTPHTPLLVGSVSEGGSKRYGGRPSDNECI